jgi:hypothetical protein
MVYSFRVCITVMWCDVLSRVIVELNVESYGWKRIVYLRLWAAIDWLVYWCGVAFTRRSGLWMNVTRVTVFIFLVYSVTCRLQETVSTAPRLFTGKHCPESFRRKLHTVKRENFFARFMSYSFFFKFRQCCWILLRIKGNLRAVVCSCDLDIPVNVVST